MHLIVVDVDTGVDDAWALFLLMAHDPMECKILGITCVNGNTDVDNVCTNTLRVCSVANRNDIPVFKGAGNPLIKPDNDLSAEDLRFFHGRNGLGDVSFPDLQKPPKLQTENAVVFLNRIASKHKGEVSLVCTGPLTNIALAIRTYPEFLDNIGKIFIMGGNYTAMGNTTRSAEFNFHMDPEAANIVITSAIDKVLLLPWETCYGLSIPHDWRSDVLGSGGGAAIKMLNKAEGEVIERGKRLGYASWITCDQALAAVVLRPGLVEATLSLHATVELAGLHTRGQIVVDHLNTRRHNMKIIKAINQEGLQNLLLKLKEFPVCTKSLPD